MMPGHHRKRYSSSFVHRYAATGGAGSEGSAGSGERDRDRVAVSGFGFLIFCFYVLMDGWILLFYYFKKNHIPTATTTIRYGIVGWQGASFLSTNTDDDEISIFVQEIDARKPLGGGRARTRTVSQGQSPARGEGYGYGYGYRRTESVDGRMEAGSSGGGGGEDEEEEGSNGGGGGPS